MNQLFDQVSVTENFHQLFDQVLVTENFYQLLDVSAIQLRLADLLSASFAVFGSSLSVTSIVNMTILGVMVDILLEKQ